MRSGGDSWAGKFLFLFKKRENLPFPSCVLVYGVLLPCDHSFYVQMFYFFSLLALQDFN